MCCVSADVSRQNERLGYKGTWGFCTRLLLRFVMIVGAGALSSGCSLTLPMFSLSSSRPEPARPDPAMVTSSLQASSVPSNALALVPVAGVSQSGSARRDTPSLSDHLGPEDIRRASGAMALALDPQGNGSPVSWDYAESRSTGRFTPVGGPFLREDEVCRAFLSTINTLQDKHALQGMACRPSGGDWSIRDLKPWKQP